MELEIFTPSTVQAAGRTVDPSIRVTKMGMFTLNPAAVELMGLTAGEPIAIARQKDGDRSWLVAKQPHGFPSRKGYGDTHASIVFQSAKLAKEILATLPQPDSNVKIRISNEPVMAGQAKWYPLMTQLLGKKKVVETLDELAPKRF
jgi:hypothetical protein